MTGADPPETTSETPPPMPAGLADGQFAARIREERERKGWSQGGVARQMRQRGWSWYPQTVQKAEAGHRKVSVGEAEALARIFGTTIDRLTWPGQAAAAAALLDMSAARAGQAWRQIADGTRTLLYCQFQLALTAAEAEDAGYHGSDLIRRLAGDARQLLRAAPEDAVAEGRQEFEDMRKSSGKG
ncbi:MAG TPA: helix-turn-helix transcriptional regulator [Streptosporangiaceae bacterium]|jgi:transcriptional regulator with XRE-family HTH domain|nr:helix-turn-helix transcriptional regulator [Streptosporangiaceae bacterium]